MINLRDILKTKLSYKGAKELFWIVIGQAFSIFIGIFIMKYLTKMGASDFGKYSLSLSIAALFSSILYGPIEQGFLRFYYENSENGTSKSFFNTYNIFLILIGASILFISFLYSYITNQNIDFLEIFIIALYVIVYSSSLSYNSILNLLRKRKLNAFIQVFEKSTVLLAIILLFNLKIFTFKNVLTILLIFTTLYFLIKIIFISKAIPKDISKSETSNYSSKISINTLLFYCIPFSAWGLTGWLQSNSEKWVILKYISSEQVGVYSLLTVISNYIISAPVGILNQFIQPVLFNKISNKSESESLNIVLEYNNYIILFISALTIISFIFTFYFEKLLINIIADSAFVTDHKILPFICLGVGMFNIAQASANVGIILKEPKRYIWPKIISGLLSLLLNILFINSFGFMGILYSLIITSIVYLLSMYFTNRVLIKSINYSF